jgi:hypothetical protein
MNREILLPQTGTAGAPFIGFAGAGHCAAGQPFTAPHMKFAEHRKSLGSQKGEQSREYT